MNKNSTIFLGLDLGDKFSYIVILNQDAEVIEETRLPTSKSAFKRKFSTIPSCKIAMEVGAQSRWVSDLLRELGHDVIVANARKLRAIYANPRKDDRTDAETLARLARLDPSLLSPIHHRSPQAQADLAVLRSRDALVRSRTLLINHVRGIAKSFGDRLPSCSANYFATKVAPSIPEPLQPALIPILETIASLSQQIRAYDRQVEALCKSKYPKTKLLRNVSGVGPLTALAYTLTLEDPQRFPKSRDVGPAVGLVPKRDQSGDRDPQLRITKTGNTFLRRLPGLIRPNTSLALSDRTATCVGGDCGSPSAVERTLKSVPSLRWPESWPCCSIICGRPARSMIPFTYPSCLKQNLRVSP